MDQPNQLQSRSILRLPAFFVSLSLIFLFLGLLLGIIGSFQYIFPLWLRESFPFSRIRPLHVSLVISWIFTASTGGIYFYIQEYLDKKLYSERLGYLHLILLFIVSLCTILAYAAGKFGGREYLEFPPLLGVPLILYWLLFMFNFFKTLNIKLKTAPIYMWMWATGLIFFLITFLESQLWLINFFGENLVRDTTVQWKALGSMVGSWNMLVYGTAFYVMERISGNSKVTNSKQTFFFYFLGLTNLMFNWGHHTYIVPASPWIKHIAYIISMTELLILANIIREWRNSLDDARKNFHLIPYRFLIAADFWIFVNLILAIAMSVPAINLYTHGTHITVAHAMGTTIGINTMILFSSLSFLCEKAAFIKFNRCNKSIRIGFWVSNISLLVFWLALLAAGVIKALLKDTVSHQEVIAALAPYFKVISIAGILMLLGFSALIYNILLITLRILFDKKKSISYSSS